MKRLCPLTLALGASLLCALAVAETALDIRIARDGIVAQRDVRTGDVVFGLTADEIDGLVRRQMTFRRRYAERIRVLARELDTDTCEVTERLRVLAGELADARHSADPVAPAPREAATPSDGSTTPHGDYHPPETTASSGEDGTSITLKRGIVAIRDAVINGDVVFGIPAAEMEGLLGDLRSEDVEYLDRLQTLSVGLNVSRCATASFLATLGIKGVEEENLHTRLQGIAQQHLDLVAQWKALTIQEPEVEKLRAEAKAAIDNGAHERAEALLSQARDHLRENIGQIAAAERAYSEIEGARGQIHLIRMDYERAAEAFEAAYQYARRAQPEDVQEAEPTRPLRWLELKAVAAQDAGNYADAESAFRDALREVESRREDPDPLHIATLRNNLATLYFARSEYDKARGLFEKVAKDLADAGDAPSDTYALQWAISHNGVGDTDTAMGRFEDAEGEYNQARRILETALGEDDYRLRSVLANLARLKAHRDEFDAAATLFERAGGLTRPGSKGSDPEAAAIMSNLAMLLYARGDTAAAQAHWREALKVYRSALGCDHPVTLAIMLNLASALRRDGELDQAEALFLAARDSLGDHARNRIDSDHLLFATIHDHLADLYVATDRLDDAEELYRKAEGILYGRFRAEANSHPLMASLQHDRGVIYERRGEHEEAAKAFEEARESFAESFSTKHRHYGTATSSLARVKARLGELSEAVALYEEAIAIATAVGDELKIAHRNGALARIYEQQGAIDEARTRLETAHRIYLGQLGSDHPKTTRIAARLSELGDMAAQ